MVLGVLGVSVLWSFDVLLTRLLHSDFPPVLFQLLLCSEAGLIVLVGVFVASLPRERAELPCRACRLSWRVWSRRIHGARSAACARR